MPTIRELANQAGVSASTVTRILGGDAGIDAETRERVLKLVRELEVTSDISSAAVTDMPSQVIGVILDTSGHVDLRHPVFGDVLDGLKEVIAEGGYDMLFFTGGTPAGSIRTYDYLERCRRHHVDGMILMGVGRSFPEIQKLVRSEVPCIGVDLDLTGPITGYVISDNVAGAKLAVSHLHELGRRKIATITGMTYTRPGRDRLTGYREQIKELGLSQHSEYIQSGDFYEPSGFTAMESLLALAERPDAVFCASDMMAVGAIGAATVAGLKVPDDVAIIGFDDAPFAATFSPSISTIRQDKVGLGRAAGEQVMALIDNPKATPPKLTLPVELVVRESTAGRKS
ncbi:MAG TPA: LacI family DNA-binding transcriptional regulator [Gaiellaceae bacterium]|jgi:LacI family transcriptional regulator